MNADSIAVLLFNRHCHLCDIVRTVFAAVWRTFQIYGTEWSFGFDIVAEDYVVAPDGTCTWTIRDLVLYEVSVVTFPAYSATSAMARNDGGYDSLKTIRLKRRKKELLERICKNA